MNKDYKKTGDYLILFDKYEIGLENKIAHYIQNGYDLQGGVSVSQDSVGNLCFAQAVVKAHN